MFVSRAARTNSDKILADDSETMTETLERALAPLLTFGSFFGLGMFEYPHGQPRAYLSCLYGLTKWGSFTYIYYYSYLKNVLRYKTFDIQIINLVLINTLIH